MRKTVSLILTASFAITAVSGIILMFAHMHSMKPIHEIMALIMTVAGILHAILNAKCIGNYIKEKPLIAGIVLILTVAVTALLMLHPPEHPNGRGPRPPQESRMMEHS
ncbi:MAG: DUF4405 domain-containing protein [Vulcanimicrobiota bacterium]